MGGHVSEKEDRTRWSFSVYSFSSWRTLDLISKNYSPTISLLKRTVITLIRLLQLKTLLTCICSL